MPPPLFALVESEVSAERADEVISRILARPEFITEPSSVLDRGRDAVFDRLGELLDAVTRAGTGSIVGWAIVAILVLAVLVAVWRFSRSVGADAVVAPLAAPFGPRSGTDWRSIAAEAEAQGNWRAALRGRWRALVADLDRQGLVEEIPGRTAGEYRRQLGASAPAAAADFAGATAIFEDVWYGDLPAGADEVRRLSSLSERVLAAIRAPAA